MVNLKSSGPLASTATILILFQAFTISSVLGIVFQQVSSFLSLYLIFQVVHHVTYLPTVQPNPIILKKKHLTWIFPTLLTSNLVYTLHLGTQCPSQQFFMYSFFHVFIDSTNLLNISSMPALFCTSVNRVNKHPCLQDFAFLQRSQKLNRINK